MWGWSLLLADTGVGGAVASLGPLWPVIFFHWVALNFSTRPVKSTVRLPCVVPCFRAPWPIWCLSCICREFLIALFLFLIRSGGKQLADTHFRPWIYAVVSLKITELVGGSWDLSLTVRIICKEGTTCRVLKVVPGSPSWHFHSRGIRFSADW